MTKLRMADFQCRVEHSLDSKINFLKISHKEVVKYLNRNVISLTALQGIWFHLEKGWNLNQGNSRYAVIS